MLAIIGLQLDPAQSEDPGDWLTVCPPACWDMSWVLSRLVRPV
jgi:hypothetical protein